MARFALALATVGCLGLAAWFTPPATQPPAGAGPSPPAEATPRAVCDQAGISPAGLLIAGLSSAESLSVVSRAADPRNSPQAYHQASRELAIAGAQHQDLVNQCMRSPLNQELRARLAQSKLQMQTRSDAASQARAGVRSVLLGGVNETAVAKLDRVPATARSRLPVSFAAVGLSPIDRQSLIQQLIAERRLARDPQLSSRLSEEDLATLTYPASTGSRLSLAVVRTDPSVRAADEALRTQRTALEAAAANVAPPQP